ncbi:hypothetical protein MSPP1_001499 [Malassezia sp. CBS 17886]|nr:hypothetical protein MSPP1_001499 [Malassezia sp. CBS 17886]
MGRHEDAVAAPSPRFGATAMRRRTDARGDASVAAGAAPLRTARTPLYSAGTDPWASAAPGTPTPRQSARDTVATPPRHAHVGEGTPRTPLLRKGAYSSPIAARLSSAHGAEPVAAGDHGAAEPARAPGHPLRRPLRERLAQLPGMLQAYAQSWQMDLEDWMYESELGIPAALLLHALALVAQMILPGSSLGVVGRAAGTGATRPSLFASGRHAEGYSAYLGRVLATQRNAALRVISRTMSLALVLLAAYNAYVLFSRRRKYRLWYRDEKDVLSNAHAVLEDPPTDPPPPRSWRQLVVDAGVVAARQIPVVEWFVPRAPEREPLPPSERVYSLSVWDVFDTPLIIFALFSPAHALWWAVSGSLGMHALGAWTVTPLLLAGFSTQAYILAMAYAALVKDRQVLSAEMLREYDEKVCLPRRH